MSASQPPANGEKNAITGYSSQYEFSAWTIYRSLQQNSLDGISICDPAAGMCDDLVLMHGDTLIAHQIKSEQNPSAFRFRTLLINGELISEIAKSWLTLKAEYPQKDVYIYYVLAGFPSTNDKSQLSNIGTSAEFFNYLTHRDHDLTRQQLQDSDWFSFINELEEASGLSTRQFLELFNRLRIFDQRELTRREIVNLDEYAKKRVRQIKHLIENLVIKSDVKRYWSEEELIEELGWSRIAGVRNIHSFPIQPDVQINNLVESKILDAIQNHNSGYLSLLGPPGTGKSTTLERALHTSSKLGVARYLAFVPDERQGLGRAEATGFLNDITRAMEKLGFHRSRFAEEQELGELFLAQLEEARDLFVEKGQKTLIIIDGLDHIAREENPQHNFLNILPQPQSVPQGVLFLLGSQYLNLEGLKASIVQQASAVGRSIEMTPLPKPTIFAMADLNNLPEWIDREKLYEVSSGHPLIARYYIERLSTIKTESESDQLLSSGEIGTNIEQMYELVWQALDPKGDAKQVLGLLARADNTITPSELAGSVNEDAVEEIRTNAGFLLSGVEAGDWQIFHNSFRLFIGGMTRLKFGQQDASIEINFNQKLAEIAANAQKDSAQKWLELRYRARAGDLTKVKALATTETFRKQLADFRPPHDIYTDLRLSYSAIEGTEDIVKFVQLLLIEKEIDYRLESISQLDLVDIHLQLEKFDQAVDLAFSTEVRSSIYKLVSQLYGAGDTRARAIFETIEPIEYFFGSKNKRIGTLDMDALYDWIECAHRFRSREEILDIVNQLDFEDYSRPEATEQLRYVLARSILNDNPSLDVNTLSSELELTEKSYLHLIVHAILNREANEVLELLTQLEESQEVLSDYCKRVCAHTAVGQGKYDLARSFMRGLKIHTSNEFDSYFYRDKITGHFTSTFTVARLCEILDLAIPFDSDGIDENQRRALEWVIRLGRLQGKIEKAKNPIDVYAKEELVNACTFFALAPNNEQYAHYDYLMGSLTWFANTIVRISALHSPDTLKALESQIEQLYRRGDNRLSKFTTFKIPFAKAVYFFDGDHHKAVKRLEFLSELVETEDTPHQAVELRVDHALALSEVDAPALSQTELAKIHDDTCGYWLAAKKEPQYEFWNTTYERACRAAPTRVRELTLGFARFVIGLSDSEGSDTAQRVSYGLLKNSAADPGLCAALVDSLAGTYATNWSTIASAVLNGIAETRPDLAHLCFDISCSLVIPFAGENSRTAFFRIHKGVPEQFRAVAEERFIESVVIHTSTSEKVYWLSELEKVSNNSRLLDALEEARNDLQDLREYRRDTSGSGDDDYEQKQSTIDQLESLLDLSRHSKSEEKGSEYLYSRRAVQLVQSASQEDIENFLSASPGIASDTKFLIAATSRFFSLGINDRANDLLVQTRSAVRSGNWSGWLGGEKLEFQKLLQTHNLTTGADGFNSLVEDFASGQSHASMTLPDLPEILDLLYPETPWADVWRETLEHFTAYREYAAGQDLFCNNAIVTHENLLGHLLRVGYSQLCYVLTDRIRESLVGVFHHPNKGLFDQVTSAMINDRECELEIASILWKQVDNPRYRERLVTYARTLNVSQDGVVTGLARNILHHLDEKFDIPQEDLPPAYVLGVIGDENAENFELLAGVEPGDETWFDDPWFWTTALKFEISVIADASGMEIEAIRRRCAELMRREGGEAAFGPPAESELENRLRRLDLRFPYARLMPHFALRALREIVEELVRARRINMSRIGVVWSELGGPHFSNYDLPIVKRSVPPPATPESEYFEIKPEEFLETGRINTLVPLVEDWFVLAEHAEFQFLGRFMRCSVFRTSMSDFDWKFEPDEYLHGLPRMIELDRPEIVLDKDAESILCNVAERRYGDIRNTTITLNSNFIRKLGWQRSRDALFDIHSSSGELVAKTIRWSDGIGYPENSQYERSGTGSVLLISHGARQHIESIIGPLRIRTRLIQKHESRDGLRQASYFDGELVSMD